MTKETNFTKVALFGDAMTLELPKEYYSIAGMRQIPNNQEVFVFEDDSIVIELLESAEGNTATEAISFHFDVIKEDNEATESKVELVEEISVPLLENGGFGAVLLGKQIVDGLEVEMGIVLLRLDNVSTDIVVTWHKVDIYRDSLIHLAQTLKIEKWTLFN